MTDVIIGYDRLTVVLAYLADKAPEDVKQRREWARCMAILSAQRKTAPGATKATLCAQSNCATFAICARNVEGPCGLYDHVTATPPNQYDPATVAFPAYAADIAALRSEFEELKQIDADSFMTILGRVSDLRDIAEALDATTKAHELKTHERELNEVIDSLSARMDALSVQLAELDKDHVDLVKCYVHHLREHMPEALRNAGEVPSITREELAGVDELRAEVVALEREVTAQPGYFDAAIAKAIAAHEIATAEHFQGQMDTLSRVVDEDRKAVVAHEATPHGDGKRYEVWHCPECLVSVSRIDGYGPTFFHGADCNQPPLKAGIAPESKTCPTCYYHAICRKSDIIGNVGCESWEGQHPK
jgi:rubrerythrin